MLPEVILPVTASEVNVPTDVMLVCAAVVSVPPILPAVSVLVALLYVKLAFPPNVLASLNCT